MSRLRIAEIFASVQGEGVWAGIPSAFVRVSGCNLRCAWCDTPYASWNPEGHTYEVQQIAEKVEAFGLNHVVLTGGEPMLFDPIDELATALRAQGKTITIETAGTIFRDLPCDLMSISPKLGNSTPSDPVWRDRHEALREQPETVQRLIETHPYQLKFVVNPDVSDDISEIERLLATLEGVEPDRVLLMPEGSDSATLWRRARMLVDACLEHNWRLAPRMHVDLFGNKRGT